eukprot:COSAG01_NODE_20906_length_928_cov_2.230398_2_plen_27_part_01
MMRTKYEINGNVGDSQSPIRVLVMENV